MSCSEYSFENLPPKDELRAALERDGAIVIKNVITPAEISAAREIVADHLSRHGSRLMLGKTQPNAAVAVPELEFLFTHPSIVSLYKTIYGEKNVVFTGHCDAHKNMISGWHKDSGESVGGYFRGDYFAADDCKVYKIALYLQDSAENDGLTVRIGSHRNRSIAFGEEVKLQTKAGDLIVFDVRLNHIGRTPDLVERLLKNISRILNKGDRNLEDPSVINRLASVYGKLAGREDRLSVFFTYGPENEYTYDFSYKNILRQKKQTSVVDTKLDSALVSSLLSNGVRPFDFETYNFDS